jgi:hypothetical protein
VLERGELALHGRQGPERLALGARAHRPAQLDQRVSSHGVKHFAHLGERKPSSSASRGVRTAIIDCTERVSVGRFATVAADPHHSIDPNGAARTRSP